jgi:alanine-synthesizing transaminase
MSNTNSSSQPGPFKIEYSSRIAHLPPYVFGRINKMKYEKRVAGIDIVDLGMGNPTDPTPAVVVEKLAATAADAHNHRYSVAHGIAGLREAVAQKYRRLYSVELNAESEVIATIGSKEGFSHLCLALLGPGDSVVVPEPAFPIHIYAVAMAGANVIRVPLGNDIAFLDRVEKVIAEIYPTPKMLILNYPHNPTAMTVDQGFWERAIEIARKHNVMLISDLAYGEVCFDGYHAPSFLAAAGAKEVGVEFTTMSKSYNMAGWRCGFCCGNAQMVKALATIKAYYDYGLFAPIQIASLIAMRECIDFPAQQAKIYQQRRDEVCRGLDRLGWTYDKPRASMFVWAKIKEEHLKGQGTVDFSLRMMDEAAVALAPGSAFGELGEGYVRIALVENEQRLRQAMHNLERALVPRVPRPKRQPAGGAVKQSVD